MIEFYLKILSGNHIGAEIPLEPGRYSLGRDDNCDLVLTDAAINDIELILEITDEGQLHIQTSTADEPLYLNGEPSGSGIQSKPFDIITSSGLFFALGPIDAEWPELILPTLNIPIPEPEPAAEENSDSPMGEDEFPDPDTESTEKKENEPVPAASFFDDEYENEELENEETDDEDEDEEDDDFFPFSNVNKKLLIAIPVAAISTLIILFLTLGGEQQKPPPKLNHLDQANRIRYELDYRDIEFREQPDKTILVTGYTLTSKKKRDLQKLLREKGIPFNMQIVAMNELRSNADELLKSRGYKNLLLELDNIPGSLVLTGYIPTTKELDDLTTTMKQEIHGLVAIVDQVENQNSRVNTLKSMIRERNLSTRIHLAVRPGQIIVQGHLLDESQTYNLQEIVQRFRDRYGNQPKLTLSTRSGNQVTPMADAATSENKNGRVLLPALSIRGISMGRVPYVVMEDGSKYLVGAKLANGYIIEDINLEYLLLTNGTDRIKYRLGGNRGGQQ